MDVRVGREAAVGGRVRLVAGASDRASDHAAEQVTRRALAHGVHGVDQLGQREVEVDLLVVRLERGDVDDGQLGRGAQLRQGVALQRFDVSDQPRQQSGEQSGNNDDNSANGEQGLASGANDQDTVLGAGQLDLSWRGEVDIFA